MGHTRQVTGIVHKPDGSPWEGFQLDFTLVPSAVTTHATLPSATVSATTAVDGTFSIDLEVGVAYQVTEYGALIRSGTSTRYPAGTQYTIVVPDGDTPISLHDIRAADATPVTPTLLGRVLPEGGTTGQALVKASGADYDAAWGDVAGGGADAVWGGIGGTLADQTDLQTALDTKADAASLGSAAATDATAYATAAQGNAADTAVQPDDLAPVATSGAYSDLTGTPTIPTMPDVPEALTDLDTAVTGAQLNAIKTKVDGISAGAEVNVNADWDATSGDAQILNKPTLFDGDYTSLTNRPTLGTAAAAATTDFAAADHGHAIADVTGLQPALDGKADDTDLHSHANKAVLDATTASYTTAEATKLGGIAAGATANATDAELRDRATHTGMQAISTVSGLQDALDGKADSNEVSTIVYVIDGGGSEIATGYTEDLPIGFGGTPVGWDVRADQVGSFVATISKATYAAYPTFTAISGSEQPTLSSERKNQDTDLTTWSGFAAGDTLRLEVNSATTVKHVVVSIHATRA